MASEDDRVIAEYLETVDEYKAIAEKAGECWSLGFIDLAHAQQVRPIGQHNYDLNVKANAVMDGKVLKDGQGVDPMAMFGGPFAPQALKSAQAYFTKAIELTIQKQEASLRVQKCEAAVPAVFDS